MRMQVRVVLVLSLAIMGLAGCDHYNCSSGATFGNSSCTATGGGLGTGGGGTAVAYAFAIDTSGAAPANGTIDGLTLTASTFGPTAGFAAPTIPFADQGEGIVVAQNKYLYAVFSTTQQIYGWSIDSGGNLTLMTGFPITAPFSQDSFSEDLFNGWTENPVITNPTGTLLFIADDVNNQILVYQIGSSGGLTPALGSPFSTPDISPENLGMDGKGLYLYASAFSDFHAGSVITGYSVSPTGVLAEIAGSPFNAPLWQMQGDPTGQFLIGISGKDAFFDGVDDDSIYVYNISGTGAPVLPGTVVTTTYAPVNLAVQPVAANGALIYTFSISILAKPNAVEGYALNPATGALTADANSPFTTDSFAPWGQFDPAGAYLFFLSEQSFVPYQVSTGGTLTSLVPSALASPGYWAIADPQ